jgi:hypothetical protein
VTNIPLTLVIIYSLITCYFFCNWLLFSHRHPASTPEEKFLSFVFCVITTIFWPLMIPISGYKIIKTRQLEPSTIIPLLLGIFGLGISYWLNLNLKF